MLRVYLIIKGVVTMETDRLKVCGICETAKDKNMFTIDMREPDELYYCCRVCAKVLRVKSKIDKCKKCNTERICEEHLPAYNKIIRPWQKRKMQQRKDNYKN
jgi:hypothetical protein